FPEERQSGTDENRGGGGREEENKRGGGTGRTALVVEIPPYRNQRISSPVQVNIYVCNGKRKRSQYQRFTYLSPNVPIIKTEPNDEYEPLGAQGLSVHSKPYYGQPRLTPIIPVGDADTCLVGGYPSCPPCHGSIGSMPASSPSSSPTLHDLSPVAYPKCLSTSPTHAHTGPLAFTIQETPGQRVVSLIHPSSPDHAPLGMLHSQGSSPHHLGSPGPHGYHTLYPNSSPSSSPGSHPSTPGGAAESPFAQAPPYSPTQGQSQTQARSSPPSLLPEDASPPSLAVTVKREPQDLDQMYLDD
ncbi:unnamed protein product, partial [Coregonus sp. 'balchen']